LRLFIYINYMAQTKGKILIIEDETSLSEVLAAKLKKEGYDIATASDGESGYQKINSWEPKLILLDIVMPKMDGYEVLEKLNQDGNKTPVIIISNSGQPVEIEKTRKLGAVDHLIKTEFDPEEVVKKVHACLGDDSGPAAGGGRDRDMEPIAAGGEEGPDLGINVLLVEDDNFLRSICSKKLIKEGFTVYEALDGEMALNKALKIKPDIILLDIILPALDGFEVLSRIRSNSDKIVAQVPIIMLSNLGQDEDIKKALAGGANDYLVKAHFTIEEIVAKVKKLLNR